MKKYKGKFIDMFHKYLDLSDQNLASKIAQLSIYEKIFLYDDDSKFYNKFNEILEKVGITFNIDNSLIYSTSKYNKLLSVKVNDISRESFADIYSKRHSTKLKRLFNDDLMVAYLYNYLNNKNDINDILNLVLIFPNAFLSALYLYIIQ